MSDLIDEFCDWHFAYNDLSADRRTAIRRVLREFESSLDGRAMLEANAGDLERFLAVRLESMAPATVKKIQYQVRPFFTWAHRRGLYNPDTYKLMTAVPSPRGSSNGRPRPYTEIEMARLWKLLDSRFRTLDPEGPKYLDRWLQGRSPWRKVYHHAERLQLEAIISLALYGGMRRDEIMFRLELDDIHPDHATLPARARKNREGVWVERAIPVIPAMRERLSAWWEFRTAMDTCLDKPITHPGPWLSLYGAYRGQELPENSARKMLARLGDTAAAPKLRWEFHRLRHTAATEMLRAGYKLHIVRKIMGHSSIAMTLRYAELLDGDVVDEANRVGHRFGQRIDKHRPV